MTAPPVDYPGADKTCAAKQAAATCGDFVPECFKGTGVAGAVCNTGNQCASTSCGKAAATDTCGKCTAIKKENDPCGAADFACGGSLRCDFAVSKCVQAVAIDGDCAGAAGNCQFGLVCLSDSKKCGKPRQIGDACVAMSGTISADCRGGLDCVGGKCQDLPPTYKDLGADCSVTDTCRGKSYCINGKCTPYAKEADACAIDLSKPYCDPYAGLVCQAGKCVKAALLVCK